MTDMSFVDGTFNVDEYNYPVETSPEKATPEDSMDSVDYLAMLEKYKKIAVEMERDAAKCANHPWICGEIRELAASLAELSEMGGK